MIFHMHTEGTVFAEFPITPAFFKTRTARQCRRTWSRVVKSLKSGPCKLAVRSGSANKDLSLLKLEYQRPRRIRSFFSIRRFSHHLQQGFKPGKKQNITHENCDIFKILYNNTKH